MRKTQRTAAYGVLMVDEQILLVQASARSSLPGRWFLPGGGVEHGEQPSDTVEREVFEETGLTATAGPLLGVLADVVTNRRGEYEHTIRLIFRVVPSARRSAELHPEADGTSGRPAWWPVDALPEQSMTYVREAIELGGLERSSFDAQP